MSRRTWAVILAVIGVVCIAVALWYPISYQMQKKSTQDSLNELRAMKVGGESATDAPDGATAATATETGRAQSETEETPAVATDQPVSGEAGAPATPAATATETGRAQSETEETPAVATDQPVSGEAGAPATPAATATEAARAQTEAAETPAAATEQPVREETRAPAVPPAAETPVPAEPGVTAQTGEAELAEAPADAAEEDQYQTLPTVEVHEAGTVQMAEEALQDAMLPQFRELYRRNRNFIGWLTIPGTDVDHPVVQTPQDNEHYLHRDFDGNENKNGTLILEGTCDPFTPSANLIIYGHNMRSGMMFGRLSLYLDKKYWQEHRLIRFDTLTRERTYVVVAAVQSTQIAGGGHGSFRYTAEFDDEEDLQSWLDYIRRRRRFDTGVAFDTGDSYLTLSTCAYHEENGRLLIIARELRPSEDPEQPDME